MSEERRGIIYLLTNRVNGKQYVGQTVSKLDERWYAHVGGSKIENIGMLICQAICEFGPDAFSRCVLVESQESKLDDLEVSFIAKLRTHFSFGGYNMTLGGAGKRGLKQSPESNEKRRQKMLGRKHSTETKKKIGISGRGRKLSGWHRTKLAMSASREVVQLDRSGNVVETYFSIANAAKLSGISMGSIKKSLFEKRYTVGFLWKYRDEISEEI